MATILITGGNGQLGSELKKISGQFSGYNFIFTDIAELDISDPTASNKFYRGQQTRMDNQLCGIQCG